MKAESTGKQTIAEGDLQRMLGAESSRHQEPGAQIGPKFQVGGGVGHERWLSCCAGRSVISGDSLTRHGQKAKGTMLSKVGLGSEGQAPKIIQAAGAQIRLLSPRFDIIRFSENVKSTARRQ